MELSIFYSNKEQLNAIESLNKHNPMQRIKCKSDMMTTHYDSYCATWPGTFMHFLKVHKSKFYHCFQHINLMFLVFITYNPTGSGKISKWGSLVNILKGHDFKILPQVPWFQQFCILGQVADKSLALKTANSTIINNNKIHPQTEPVPTNHSEMLTASWGFPTVGTWKAAAILLTKCRWWERLDCFRWCSGGWILMGKPLRTSTDEPSDAAVSSRYWLQTDLFISCLLLFLHFISQITALPSTQWPKLETSELAFLYIPRPPKSRNLNSTSSFLAPLPHFRSFYFPLDYY